MRKISLLLFMSIVLFCCKTDSGDVDVPVSPVLNPKPGLPPAFYATHGLYDGQGTINTEGKMEYNILMPLLKNGKYSFVSFLNISDNVLFMQMQDYYFEPTDKNAIYTLSVDVDPLALDVKEEISVYLYFENGKILNQKEAERIYHKGCSAMNEPKKCGTGVLTYAEL